MVYTYDALDRLVSAGRRGVQAQYSYDAVGNRLDAGALPGMEDRDVDGRGLRATYDGANQLTAIVGPDSRPLVRYTYDGNGNLVSRSGFGASVSYAWDGANHLSSVTHGDDLRTSYTYDDDG